MKRGKIELGWGQTPTEPEAPPPTPEGAPPAEPVATPAPASASPRARRPKAAGEEVGINLRLSPPAWTALSVLAARNRRAKQDLLLEALDLLFEKYGEEPVARKTALS